MCAPCPPEDTPQVLLRRRGSRVGSCLPPAGEGTEQPSGCDLRLLLPRIFENGPLVINLSLSEVSVTQWCPTLRPRGL